MKIQAIFLLGILFTTCVWGDQALGVPEKSVAPRRVGVIAPLTGPLAEYGQAFQNGLELAKRDFPAVSEHCQFILEDSKYDSKTAVAAFQKLIASDKVAVVFNWGGPTSEAVAPIAERQGTPLLVWSADPGVSEGRRHVVRFANSGADYGAVLAEYLLKRGYKRVGVVRTENQYIEAIFNGLLAAAKGRLEVETVDSYQPGDQDFRPTVTKLRGKAVDAIGAFVLSGQVAQFSRQLRDQSVELPLFGTDFFESMTEVAQSQGAMIGAVFANNEVTANFRTAYTGRFQNDLQINHGASGYDFAMFLCGEVLPRVEAGGAEEIMREVQGARRFQGTQGEATFVVSERSDKYFRFPVVIRRVGERGIVTEPG